MIMVRMQFANEWRAGCWKNFHIQILRLKTLRSVNGVMNIKISSLRSRGNVERALDENNVALRTLYTRIPIFGFAT